MCDSSIKQTQILLDSETLPNGFEMAEEKQEDSVWGRLFPIGSQFKQIGKFLNLECNLIQSEPLIINQKPMGLISKMSLFESLNGGIK